MNVSEAVDRRRSTRAFLETDVDPALLRTLLKKAARAPSGGNIQPWHLHLVRGECMAVLKAMMARLVVENPKGEGSEYPIYPPQLDEPYRGRVFGIGEQLYGHLGIAREDKASRRAWFARNYQFFGAPVGLFTFVSRNAGSAQWADLGMYLQTLMLLLEEGGLASCAQEAWAIYPRTIAQFVAAPEDQMLFCGTAIGYADTDHPANRLRSDRAPAEEYLIFHD